MFDLCTTHSFHVWILKEILVFTALLKVTEDWRLSFDNRGAVIDVTVELSKAFDSINHNLLLAKFKAYGFSLPARL